MTSWSDRGICERVLQPVAVGADETAMQTAAAPDHRDRTRHTSWHDPKVTASVLVGPRERLAPWLIGAMVGGVVTVGALEIGDPTQRAIAVAVSLVVLCACLAGAGLVAARSRATVDLTEREQRDRPAPDQLAGLEENRTPHDVGPARYFAGMHRWASALHELMTHASDVTDDPRVAAELDGAAEDTDALRDLLQSTEGRALSLSEAATLHSVCALWETDQERLENLAAGVDPRWHRRWRARTLVERLLRQGRPQAAGAVLPYRC